MKNNNKLKQTNSYKEKLRKKIQNKRDNLRVLYRKEESRIIAEKFFNTVFYINSKNILIYYPFKSEVDVTIIIKEALKNKKKIILPRIDNHNLRLFYVNDLKKHLEIGTYGIMEPVIGLCRPADISDIDLAVVPGVGFDKKFNRLGYGGGFYDKLLLYVPEGVKKIALCFDIQVVGSIPASENDIKVDCIITETEIYHL